jgi:hypothetical protein
MMTFTTLNATNNSVLYSQKAMPSKDITSNNENDFAMYRRSFIDTYKTDTDTTLSDQLQKRWYGGTKNRDASRIIDQNRIHHIGNGSLNSNKQAFAFNNKNDKNSEREALVRVRHIGSAAPPKKIHNYPNAPVFY